MNSDKQKSKRVIYSLALVYFILSCGIIAGSILLYQSEKTSLINDDTNELNAIANIKVRQISGFRRERFSEANFIYGNESFIADTKNYIKDPRSPGNKKTIDDWLITILHNHNYESITIIDTSGKVVYAAGNYDPSNDKHIPDDAVTCMRENKILFGDLHLHSDGVTIHLEIFVPLVVTGPSSTENVGVVNFTLNPNNGLFDLIQSWPINSQTAEVLIVRQDGDSVLFLNELRFRKDTALKFRLPMNLPNLPSVFGLNGEQGVMEGVDYNGKEVLFATKWIPDTKWLLVAKIDMNEVLEPLTPNTVLIFSMMTALLFAGGTAFLLILRGESIRKLEMDIQSVDTVKRLNRVYQVLSDVNQAIVKIEDRETLLNEICRVAIDAGYFRLCWIGFVDLQTGSIRPAAKAGPACDYLDQITISIYENTSGGQGPSGTAFRTGKPVIYNDIPNSFRMSPWKENAAKYRLKSSVAFPISGKNGPIGTINFYSDQINFFTEDEIRLLEELSSDLSYSLQNIEKEKEKIEAEEARRRSDALLKEVMDNLPIGIAVNSVDPEVKFTYMNDRFFKNYRTTKEALADEGSFWDAVYEDAEFREAIKKRVLDDCASGDATRMHWEDVPVTREGKKTSYISAQNILIPDTKLMISLVWDVTERKLADLTLVASETRYRRLFESAKEGILILDAETGSIMDVNPFLLTMLGFTKEQFIKKTIWEIGFFKDIVANYDKFLELQQKEYARYEDLPLETADGRKFDVEFVSNVYLVNQTKVIQCNIRDITERKRLAQIATLQNAALKATANAIVITDPDGTIEWANPAFSELTGYSFEEAVGKNPRDLVKSGVHENAYYKDLWTAITSGEIWQGEMTNRRKDGSLYTEEQTITPLLNAQGKITHFIGVKQDITKRKHTEQEISLLANALKSINECVSITDANDTLMFVNDAFANTYGYRKEELIGKNITIVRSPKNTLADMNQILPVTVGRGWEGELWNRRKDGSDSLIHLSTTSILDSQGQIVGLIGVAVDITDRKLAEEAIIESEKKYKSFFDDDLTGDYISTPDGRLLACNLPFAKIFGYDSVEEVMKANTGSLYPDPKMREMLMKRLTLEKRIEYQSSELVRRDGKKVYVIENMIGTFDKNGKLTEIRGYLFNDSERRNLEHQLIQAQKMESLGTLAGGIAHDFNNILAIVLGHISLIKRKFSDNEYIAENSDTISKATQRGAGLVKQLLTFARKTDITLESILIQDTINEIRKFIEQTFPKTVTIQTEYEKNLPPIVADSTQIHQVLLNLCINARDAMAHGGILSITASRIKSEDIKSKLTKIYSAEYIQITVSDTGTGMDEEIKSRIFEPFFTTKGRERGTGLGLATVYGIITAHHGTIDVQTAVGKGTSFYIYFPVQQSFIEHVSGEINTEEIPGGSETILIVDDEESMKNLLTTVFVEKGYKVLSASDGQEALDTYLVHHAEIDIVLTDMGLPKIGGEEVVVGIKKIDAKAKIIVASGYFERNLKSELLKSGVKDFVQKPYLPDEILKKVRELLDLK